ncbi:hypothetical protein E1B28_007538 [Marasmius oreades]|uniref:Zn(2)-C6 fungal-type domain-containing protein n=1 Tax=Marasmius oreades TaxID=181124 RepID=A0A9P7S255_9AGAR|nr:uncharacterized protein E1B28_007538 [Marasmius oreades]KAG7093900.1 hypothetical protein E1B28_007538 [Marasmius oreades]
MASTSSNSDGRPKRKRLAKACDACHKSKRRCDGVSPCANCFFASKTCTYTDSNGRPVPAPRSAAEQPSHSHNPPQSQPYYPVLTKRHRPDAPNAVSQSQPTEQRPHVPMELDGSLTRELTNLFFTHCHPVLATIHKPSFTNALSLNQVPPHLLFAICALAARFSKQPSLRASRNRFSGRAFADEARRLMFEDHDAVGRLIVPPSLPTAQALCILSIFEILSRNHQVDPNGQPGTTEGDRSELQDRVQWARGERYRDLTLHVVHALGAHMPDPPLLTPVPSQSFIESSIERESVRRVFWLVYLVDLLRGIYYRFDDAKLGRSGNGYAGTGINPEHTGNFPQATSGFDPNFGPASASPQPPPNFPPPSLASALGFNEGVMGFSEVELKIRLPSDETSFELGTIHESIPEYLHLSAPHSPDASELGHVMRVMTIHQRVEQALSELIFRPVPQHPSFDPTFDPSLSSRSHPQPESFHPHLVSHSIDTHPDKHPHAQNGSQRPLNKQSQRHLAAIHRLSECSRVLDEWAESLPHQLRFTETNLHVHKSMFETSSNTSAWCFACMHALYASCSIALAVGFRGIRVDSTRGSETGSNGAKPGDKTADRNDLSWAVERLHIILELVGERAKFSTMLGVVIWPLLKYVHKNDAEMKYWEELFEDYTGVRMTKLTGSRWEEQAKVPVLVSLATGQTSSNAYALTSLASTSTSFEPNLPGQSGTHDLDSLPGALPLDGHLGIAPSLVSTPVFSHQTQTQPSTSLPSLKSSGLLEWQGSLVSHPPTHSPTPSPPHSQPSISQHNVNLPTSDVQQQSSTPNESGAQGRVGLSWMMNS